MEQRMREMEHEMKHLSGDALQNLMEQYNRISTEFEHQKRLCPARARLVGVLKGLGFTEDEFQKKDHDLIRRSEDPRRARTICCSPPRILCCSTSRPTIWTMNSIAWLENYLLNYDGAVLIVAHDRYFLNRVVTKIIEIDDGRGDHLSREIIPTMPRKESTAAGSPHARLAESAAGDHAIRRRSSPKLKSFNREKSIKPRREP